MQVVNRTIFTKCYRKENAPKDFMSNPWGVGCTQDRCSPVSSFSQCPPSWCQALLPSFPPPGSPSSRFSYLGCRLAAGSQTGHFPPSFRPELSPASPAPSCQGAANKQTSQRLRPGRPSSHPQVSAAVGVGSSAALPCGHGWPAAGDPPTLPSALRPLRAATSEKPLCLLLQSEALHIPRLAKWRWGNCRNPGVMSPSWLQTPVSFPEENSGRLPSGGQALGLLDVEVGTLT